MVCLLFGAKPSPQPMLTEYQLGPCERQHGPKKWCTCQTYTTTPNDLNLYPFFFKKCIQDHLPCIFIYFQDPMCQVVSRTFSERARIAYGQKCIPVPICARSIDVVHVMSPQTGMNRTWHFCLHILMLVYWLNSVFTPLRSPSPDLT